MRGVAKKVSPPPPIRPALSHQKVILKTIFLQIFRAFSFNMQRLK
jgi:hypothetical protein